MTQAICDITTDEVNVDVVVEPQADTMVEVANRAGGMEQVFHDNTLIGNGNSVDLGVNTEIIATKEYVDEKVEFTDTYTKDEIDDKFTVANAQIDANADAIQKTRDDYIEADSEIHQILNAHASELTTHRNDIDGLGDQVSAIEEKIPETASAENPLVTRSEISSVYKFKGSVATYNDLPTGATVGDVYNVTDTGANYAWDGSAWDKLSETVDLSSYATTAYVNAREQEIRDDVNQADSELQSQITAQASAITENTTSINGVKAVIPDGTYDTNPLINKQQLLDEEMDIREDLNSGLGELQTQITAQAAAIAGKQDQLTAGDNITIVDNVISATGGGGGMANVVHDTTLTGSGTDASPLGLAEAIKDEIASKAPTATVDALTAIVNDILTTYLKKTGDTMTGALTVPEFTVSTAEGTLSISVVAGVPVIASNNGIDIASRVKFDYAPTTDDNTTWTNALDTSLVSKRQVASAISSIPVGIDSVVHDNTLTGSGTDASLLGVNTEVIATKEDLEYSENNTLTEVMAYLDETVWPEINSLNSDKQDKLTAGENITIDEDGVISASGGGTTLPDQTGNENTFLMTDGATPSWSADRLVVKSGSVAIGTSAAAYNIATNRASVAIGRNAQASGTGCISIGGDAGRISAANNTICIGRLTNANALHAIQLGGGSSGYTNSDENTFKVGNRNGNFEMMSADGTIPAERMSAVAGTTGQVLTKTDTGMAWADASGGDGDIDCGVMS